MSAFLVDKTHIDVLVRTALEGPRYARNPSNAWHSFRWWHEDASHEVNETTVDAVGEMLWSENHASVEARYPSDTSGNRPGPSGLTDEAILCGYSYTDPHYTLTVVEALQAIRCYEYQSCEHDGWKDSSAAAFCETLRVCLCHYLPGMDDAPWEWTPDMLRQRRAAA
jgi:hypothetical protein